MKLPSILAFIMTLFMLIQNNKILAQYYYPPAANATWEKVTPQSLGWNVSLLDSLQNFLASRNTKSFVILNKGKIVLEWYFEDHSKDKLWYWASAGKTLTAGLVGIAESKNQLKLTDPTSKYLNKQWTSCNPISEEKITIWHQMTMTTGFDEKGNLGCTDAVCLKCIAEPGSRWFYHNAPYTLLDEVILNATKQNLTQYFRSEIGQKIGMDGIFIKSDENNVFYSSALSMARYGHLLLSQGKWNSTQVIPADFIKRLSNSSQAINPSYGFLTWLNGKDKVTLPGSIISFKGPIFPSAPQDLYAALGKNDQKLHVVPSMDLVLVRMGNAAYDANENVPLALDREIWEYLGKIVGFKPSSTDEIQDNILPNAVVNTLVTDNLLKIDTDFPFKMGTIFNKDGQKMMDFTDNTIDISNLNNGFYMVTLRLNNGSFRHEKIFKL